MSYKDEVERARRLAMLQALYFADGYCLHRQLLRTRVEAAGYVTSGDKLAAEIAWLAEIGLVEPLELDAVRLTGRGADVALGRAQVPGVRRPYPGDIDGSR